MSWIRTCSTIKQVIHGFSIINLSTINFETVAKLVYINTLIYTGNIYIKSQYVFFCCAVNPQFHVEEGFYSSLHNVQSNYVIRVCNFVQCLIFCCVYCLQLTFSKPCNTLRMLDITYTGLCQHILIQHFFFKF